MTTTTYKGAALPTAGGESGTWGTNLNTNTFPVFDKNLGGIVSKSLSNVNVTLNASESQNAILRLTGTLSGAVQITTAAQGFTFIENLTTGAFAITFTNGIGAVATVLQGKSCVVVTDATNGAFIISEQGFESGTTMVFAQTSAPIGWTKITTHNDKALRIVSGTVSSGGSINFSTAFSIQPVVGTNSTSVVTGAVTMPFDNYEHTSSAVVPSGVIVTGNGSSLPGHPMSVDRSLSIANATAAAQTFTGTSIDMTVKYADVIFASRN